MVNKFIDWQQISQNFLNKNKYKLAERKQAYHDEFIDAYYPGCPVMHH